MTYQMPRCHHEHRYYISVYTVRVEFRACCPYVLLFLTGWQHGFAISLYFPFSQVRSLSCCPHLTSHAGLPTRGAAPGSQKTCRVADWFSISHCSHLFLSRWASHRVASSAARIASASILLISKNNDPKRPGSKGLV